MFYFIAIMIPILITDINVESGEVETFFFKVEINQLLSLIITIFYNNREIFLKRLKRKGYEVLFKVDDINEYIVGQVKEYDGKNLVSTLKEGWKLEETEEEKKKKEEKKAAFDNPCKVMKDILGDKVEKVVVSYRIVDSPCCLMMTEYVWVTHMERIMKAQALHNNSMSSCMSSKKTMEINPENSIMEYLRKRAKADKHEKSIKDMMMLLY